MKETMQMKKRKQKKRIKMMEKDFQRRRTNSLTDRESNN